MKLGVVLSGGGARAVAHIGVLKALEELGHKPYMVSGTSAGAIIGGMYAHGYKPDDILEILISSKIGKLFRPNLSVSGFFKFDKVKDILSQYLPENSFESLKIPMVISATNVKTAKSVFFTEGELIKPMIASSSIPVVFDPTEIDGEKYIDGGILNNLPAEPLVGYCDHIIGSNCNPVAQDYKNGGLIALVERSIIMMVNTNTSARRAMCDFVVEPPSLRNYGLFDYRQIKKITEEGYIYAQKVLSTHFNFSK